MTNSTWKIILVGYLLCVILYAIYDFIRWSKFYKKVGVEFDDDLRESCGDMAVICGLFWPACVFTDIKEWISYKIAAFKVVKAVKKEYDKKHKLP